MTVDRLIRAFMVVGLIGEATWLAVVGTWIGVPLLAAAAVVLTYGLGYEHGAE